MCELAGTSRSTVTHLTSSIRRRARNPASSSSSSPSGIGAVAQYGSTGSGPSATATSSRLPEPLRHAVMLRAALVPLPVHARRPVVEHLHPVRADVALAGLRILREHERKRDVGTAVVRPAGQDRQLVQRAVALHDLLAWRVLHRLRHQIAEPADHRQHLQRVHDPLGHLRRHQLVDLAARDRRASSRRARDTSAPSSRRRSPRRACRSRPASRRGAPGRRQATCTRDRPPPRSRGWG